MRLLRHRQQQLAMYGRQATGSPTDLTIAGYPDGTWPLPTPERIGRQLVTSAVTKDGSFTRGTGYTEATLISIMTTIMTTITAMDTTGTN